MKTSIRIAALTALTIMGIAQANAAVSTLAECYDLVIDHCNTTNNPQGCASGGMDECDKEFPKPMIVNPKFGLTAPQGESRPTPPSSLVLGGFSIR